MNKSESAPWWATRKTKNAAKVCGVLAILGVLVWWFWFHPYVSTDDARVAATLVRVAPQGVSGRVEKVNVEEGSRVTKGMTLIELDHRVTEANLEKAKARVALAQHELKRAEQLAAQNGIAPRELDKIRSEALTTEAEEKLSQVVFDNTFIKSPIDGIVVQKSTEVGNILEAGQAAVTVADVDNAWIAANIEETEVAELRLGQPVRISIDEGGTITGKVSEIRSAAAAVFALIPSDNAAGNFTKLVQRIPIKVTLDPRSGRVLRVGQSVEIKVRVK